MEGFSRGRKLDKVGLRSQDTGELFFDQVRLSATHLLGTEGQGLHHMMSHLPRERLGTSIIAAAEARAVFDLTVKYCFERRAFDGFIGDFQANRFSLAEMATEIDIADAYVAKQLLDYNAGLLTPSTPPRASGGPPSCRSASSISVFNCTAVTDT